MKGLQRKVIIEKNLYFWISCNYDNSILLVRNCKKFDEVYFGKNCYELKDYYFCPINPTDDESTKKAFGFIIQINETEFYDISESEKERYFSGKRKALYKKVV